MHHTSQEKIVVGMLVRIPRDLLVEFCKDLDARTECCKYSWYLLSITYEIEDDYLDSNVHVAGKWKS